MKKGALYIGLLMSLLLFPLRVVAEQCFDASDGRYPLFMSERSIGISLYDRGKYLEAIPYFERAYEMCPLDSVLNEYLYFSYKNTLRPLDANRMFSGLPSYTVQTYGLKPNKPLASLYVEGGALFANCKTAWDDSYIYFERYIVGNGGFASVDVTNEIGSICQISHHFGFTARNNPVEMKGNNASYFNLKSKYVGIEYEVSANFNISSRWKVMPYFRYGHEAYDDVRFALDTFSSAASKRSPAPVSPFEQNNDEESENEPVKAGPAEDKDKNVADGGEANTNPYWQGPTQGNGTSDNAGGDANTNPYWQGNGSNSDANPWWNGNGGNDNIGNNDNNTNNNQWNWGNGSDNVNKEDNNTNNNQWNWNEGSVNQNTGDNNTNNNQWNWNDGSGNVTTDDENNNTWNWNDYIWSRPSKNDNKGEDNTSNAWGNNWGSGSYNNFYGMYYPMFPYIYNPYMSYPSWSDYNYPIYDPAFWSNVSSSSYKYTHSSQRHHRNDLLGGCLVTYSYGRHVGSASASYFSGENIKTVQAQLGYCFYPFGNVNFYISPKACYIWRGNDYFALGELPGNWLYELEAGGKIYRRLWGSVAYLYGNLCDYHDRVSHTFYSLSCETKFRCSAQLIYLVNAHAQVYLTYKFLRKESDLFLVDENANPGMKSFGQNDNVIAGGVRWDF